MKDRSICVGKPDTGKRRCSSFWPCVYVRVCTDMVLQPFKVLNVSLSAGRTMGPVLLAGSGEGGVLWWA